MQLNQLFCGGLFLRNGCWRKPIGASAGRSHGIFNPSLAIMAMQQQCQPGGRNGYGGCLSRQPRNDVSALAGGVVASITA